MHKLSIMSLLLSTTSLPLQASAADDIKMFPSATSDQQRVVIRLPVLADESRSKVEVLVSKQLETDCNRQRLGGNLQEKTLQGWGYSYYSLEKVMGPMSTMMACPQQSKKVSAVPVVGDGYLLRYNSKLPVVIYAPKGVDVNYRLWQAEATPRPAAVE